MKRIEAHKYKTPLADNGETPFSVGVMNLTEEEAESIVAIVRLMQERRTNEIARMAALDARKRQLQMTTRVALTDLPEDIREQVIRDGARAPEPEEERNRFSGLDLE